MLQKIGNMDFLVSKSLILKKKRLKEKEGKGIVVEVEEEEEEEKLVLCW